MEDFEDYSVESVVRGHHIYKSIWTPLIGEVLTAELEEDNTEDQYAVAVIRAETIVGHVPCELRRIFYFFIRRGGTIDCTVTGHRKHGLELEVPCSYKLTGKPKYIKRLVKLLSKIKKSDDKDDDKD